MRRLLFLIPFIFIYSSSIVFAEEIALTLDEALNIAIRDNRDVLLKVEDVKKAKEKIREAQTGFYPSLSFTGNWSDTKGYYEKDDVSQNTTQTTLKEYLYKGGKTVNTIAQNKYKLTVSQALLDKTKIETALNVKKAFYTLLLATEFANVNKGILENTKEHLDVTKTRYENGQASESDVLQIKESLSSVEEAYGASLNQVEATSAILRNLLYLDKDVNITADAQFIYEPKEIAYDEAFLKAMEKRPEIKQYQAQENADKKVIEITKADNRPSIYASWDYYSRSHIAGTTTKGWNDHNVIGVTISWPIFDGWLTKSKVEQAIIDLKTTQLTKEKTTRDIALELKNAYLDLKNAITKIKSTRAQIDLYNNALQVLQDKYKAGIASSLDLNDATLSYDVSLFNQKQSIYDYILAKAKFDKAMGE